MAVNPPDRRRPQAPSIGDLLNAIQTSNVQLQGLVNILPGLVHQKAVPLKIYALAASGSQNKVVVGSLQSRRVTNIQLDSTQLYSGGFKLRQIWEGFDTDLPWIANMSAVNITVAFDESADPVNEVLTIPAGYSWWNGVLFPGGGGVAPSGGATQFVGIIDDNSNLVADVVALADAISNANNGLLAAAFGFGFNGTTWDRLRTSTVGTGILQAGPEFSFLNIAAGIATTVVKASAGILHSIVLNSAATATNTTIVYDNPTGVGTVIGRPAVTTATVPTTLLYDLKFANGLTIITATANGGDMTVVYR